MGPTKEDSDDVGDITNIESPQHHYHYPRADKSPGLLSKALPLGLALLAGTTPIGVGAYFLADAIKNKPAENTVETETNTVEKVIDWTVGEPIVE